MKKKNILLTTGALAASYLTAKKLQTKREEEHRRNVDEAIRSRYYGDKQVYLIGGGIASLAAAVYLIRDAHFDGCHIHVIEGLHILGGSNDGAGGNEKGYICRGGRMLNEETYENFWDLFAGIPSLELDGKSVTEEILNFDHLHPTHAQARLIDRDGKILDVHSMGFNTQDRLDLLRLLSLIHISEPTRP